MPDDWENRYYDLRHDMQTQIDLLTGDLADAKVQLVRAENALHAQDVRWESVVAELKTKLAEAEAYTVESANKLAAARDYHQRVVQELSKEFEAKLAEADTKVEQAHDWAHKAETEKGVQTRLYASAASRGHENHVEIAAALDLPHGATDDKYQSRILQAVTGLKAKLAEQRTQLIWAWGRLGCRCIFEDDGTKTHEDAHCPIHGVYSYEVESVPELLAKLAEAEQQYQALHEYNDEADRENKALLARVAELDESLAEAERDLDWSASNPISRDRLIRDLNAVQERVRELESLLTVLEKKAELAKEFYEYSTDPNARGGAVVFGLQDWIARYRALDNG